MVQRRGQWRRVTTLRAIFLTPPSATATLPRPLIRFSERIGGCGFIELRVVTDDDLESSFAYERGIERGGMVWSLTPEGRTALAEDASRTNGGGDG